MVNAPIFQTRTGKNDAARPVLFTDGFQQCNDAAGVDLQIVHRIVRASERAGMTREMKNDVDAVQSTLHMTGDGHVSKHKFSAVQAWVNGARRAAGHRDNARAAAGQARNQMRPQKTGRPSYENRRIFESMRLRKHNDFIGPSISKG